MDEALLWTVHSSRNDRCRIKLQNSPTWHSLHSPPINKRVLVLLSRKTVFITALLGNIGSCSSQPLRAYTVLHIPFSPLMWSTIASANVIYLNSSRNIWGTSGWSSVPSWTLRCYRNGLLWYLGRDAASLLTGINYTVTSLWGSNTWWVLCFDTKWHHHHKYLSLHFPTQPKLCSGPSPRCLPSHTPLRCCSAPVAILQPPLPPCISQ